MNQARPRPRLQASPKRWLLAGLLPGLALLLGGCADFYARRTQMESNCDVPTDPKLTQQACLKSSYEVRQPTDTSPGFELAYVEFTDQGWLHSRAQMDRALNLLKPRPDDTRPIDVVLFVHGWKHSAANDDRDVDEFRNMIVPSFAHQAGKARRTVGIYVGWRGESINVHTVRNLTFYDRKSTAEQVARGSIRELIARMRDVQKRGQQGSPIRVNLIGHSFGGLIAFNSMTGSLLDTLVASPPGAPAVPVLNMVLLLNPAFEASRYEPLFQAAMQRETSGPAGRPVFISITAENDQATRIAFPLGRALGTVLEHEAWSEEDKCPDGLTDKGECWKLPYHLRLERQTNLRTIGHLPRYATHELSGGNGAPVACRPLTLTERDLPAVPDQPPPAAEDSVSQAASLKAHGRVMAPVAPLPRNQFPLWNMRATAGVVDAHSGIYKSELWQFVARLADAEPVDQLCPQAAATR